MTKRPYHWTKQGLARRREMMRERMADPEYRAMLRASRQGRGLVIKLTAAERVDYALLRTRLGYTRDQAFAAIGREDLVR